MGDQRPQYIGLAHFHELARHAVSDLVEVTERPAARRLRGRAGFPLLEGRFGLRDALSGCRFRRCRGHGDRLFCGLAVEQANPDQQDREADNKDVSDFSHSFPN